MVALLVVTIALAIVTTAGRTNSPKNAIDGPRPVMPVIPAELERRAMRVREISSANAGLEYRYWRFEVLGENGLVAQSCITAARQTGVQLGTNCYSVESIYVANALESRVRDDSKIESIGIVPADVAEVLVSEDGGKRSRTITEAGHFVLVSAKRPISFRFAA